MFKLRFNDKQFQVAPYESVLDCLLRHGTPIPYACKAGMCQACLVRAVDCTPPAESSKWIKEDLRALGYTLACQWVPDGDVRAELPRAEAFAVAATILSLDPLNARVLRLRLVPQNPGAMFASRPGQYINVVNPSGITRSYSLANDYERDRFLELHVAATEFGVFTRWLFSDAAPGMRVHIRGPAGDCCYATRENGEYPILLAGTGTGLAPLYGIARDALDRGHAGTIHLYHGGRSTTDLYYVRELQDIAGQHDNFHYHPCVLESASGRNVSNTTEFLEGCIAASMEKSQAPRIRAYICGAPAFVFNLRKRLFLLGLRAAHLHCDPFTERTVEPAAP